MESLTVGGVVIEQGKRKRLEIPVAKLFDYTEISIPVEVVRGRKEGPTLFISAAIHGDEINGTEILRRLLSKKSILSKIHGTLIAVPVVNVFGFNNNSRYLPDRRDLNRCFPGDASGSLGSRIAHIFMHEIVKKSTHGIDLHTGGGHRCNLPQIRACIDDKETNRLAHAFDVPVIINSSLRDGSLRQAAADLGIPTLLYEGGEALRHDEKVIQCGMQGIFSVMQKIGMLGAEDLPSHKRKKCKTVEARSSYWVRAPHSGSLRAAKELGDFVEKGDLLGVISDVFGSRKFEVFARDAGIIIGMSMIPLINNGDALFHVATFDAGAPEERIELFDMGSPVRII